MGSRCVQFGVIALTLSYWSLEVQHGTSWQRTLWGSEKINALHTDGVGYKKIAKTLKLSCSTVAKTIQEDRFHLEQASPWSAKEVECTCSASYSEVCVWEIDVWVQPALLQRLKLLGGSACHSSLREPWMPTCTMTYWSRAWLPPFGDWATGQYSNMIMTTALLKKLRVKVSRLQT